MNLNTHIKTEMAKEQKELKIQLFSYKAKLKYNFK